MHLLVEVCPISYGRGLRQAEGPLHQKSDKTQPSKARFTETGFLKGPVPLADSNRVLRIVRWQDMHRFHADERADGRRLLGLSTKWLRVSSRGRWARPWAQLWPKTGQKPRKSKIYI